jgi:hypothetical protein
MNAFSQFNRQLVSFLKIIAGIVIGIALLSRTGQGQTGVTYPIVDTGQTACYDDDGAAIIED